MRQKPNEDPEFERPKAISDLAAVRVRIAAQRLRDRLRSEMRCNPDWQGEPRVPAGQTGGGQWTGDDIGPGASSASINAASSAIQLLAANKADIKFITYLCRKYGLDRDKRELLHEIITGQGLSKDEIEEEARSLAGGNDE